MNERPLQVAMIIQSYLPRLGGAERQLDALLPLLRDQGVEACIFTRRYPGMEPFSRLNGAAVHRAPMPPGARRLNVRPLNGAHKAAGAAAFTAYTLTGLRRMRPDLIHAHELLSPATTALIAHHLWGAPIVAKVLRGGELGDIRKLRERRGGLRRLRALVRHVAAFIVISREIDDELAESGAPPERRVFIPNGVDTARFSPASPAARSEARRVFGLGDGPAAVYAGRLVPEKRLDLLVSAWPAVRAAHPTAELLIAGDGLEAARLRREAGPGVHFAGLLDDVLPALQAADLFVLPSATEGLSNALLEGMAAGLPPVATAVGGAPELITPGKNGLLIPAGDRAALTAALLQLLAGPALRARLGEAARARVIADYSLQRTAAGLRALYDRLLADSRRSPAHVAA